MLKFSSLFRRMPVAAAAALFAAGCFGPTAPDVPPLPSPAPEQPTPQVPTATPVAAPVGAWQLTGTVVRSGQAVPGALVRAFDLASGDPIRWEGDAGLVLRADPQGRFTGVLPAMSPLQVVKLVAEANSQAWVAYFDTTGRGVGVALPAAYRLQAEERTLPLNVRMNAASSVAGKVFEGALKLLFRLSENRIPSLLQDAFSAAEATQREAELQLASQPALEERVSSALDAGGQWRESADSQSLLRSLGVAQDAANRLRTVLVALASLAREFEVKAGLDPLETLDFPVEGVQISSDGTLTFTDARGQVQRVSIGPNAPAGLRPSPTPTPRPASGGGGGSGGGSGGGGSRFIPPAPVPSPVQFRVLAGGRPGDASVDGDAVATAVLVRPRALAVTTAGRIFFTQFLPDALVREYAPEGPGGGFLVRAISSLSLANWSSVAAGLSNEVYLAKNNEVLRLASETLVDETLGAPPGGSGPILAVAHDPAGGIWLWRQFQLWHYNEVDGFQVRAGTGQSGVADGDALASATFTMVHDLAVDGDTGRVYMLDDAKRLRYYDPTSQVVVTLAGEGVGVEQDGEATQPAAFTHAWGLAVESSATLLVGDVPDLRRVDVASATVTTWKRRNLSFIQPENPGEGGIALDASGTIFVADYMGNRLLEVLRGDL